MFPRGADRDTFQTFRTSFITAGDLEHSRLEVGEQSNVGREELTQIQRVETEDQFDGSNVTAGVFEYLLEVSDLSITMRFDPDGHFVGDEEVRSWSGDVGVP